MITRRRLFGEASVVCASLAAGAAIGSLLLGPDNPNKPTHDEHFPGVPLCDDVIKVGGRLELTDEIDPDLARKAGQEFCSIGEKIFLYYPLDKEPEAPKSSPPTGTDEV